MQTYYITDTATASKNPRLVLSDRSNLHTSIVDNMLLVVSALPMCMLTSLSVVEISRLKYMNCFTHFRGLPLKLRVNAETNTSYYLAPGRRDLASVVEFVRNAMSYA